MNEQATDQAVEVFITRWGDGISRGGNERANLQMFVTELCTLLDLPQPDPSGAQVGDNAYVFERKLIERLADGGQTPRAVDCIGAPVFSSKARTPASKPAAAVGTPPLPRRVNRPRTLRATCRPRKVARPSLSRMRNRTPPEPAPIHLAYASI